MTNNLNNYFDQVFSDEDLTVLREVLGVIRQIFKKTTNKDVKLFLIGMRALYYYYGINAFTPAPFSIDIDINFDILLEWANYRKLIPQKIKESLETLGYSVIVDLGLMTIQKEHFLMHLTTVIEFSDEIIDDYIPELNLDVGNKYFLIYTKLSRFDPIKDVKRLKYLFKNRKIQFDEVLAFAPDLEKDIIQKRITLLIGNDK